MDEAKEEIKPVATPPAPIQVNKGTLMPVNASELVRTVNMIHKGGGFPDCFDTGEKRIAAYHLAQGLMGPKEWQLALNHMAFIKGKLAIYGELPGTLVQRTGQLKSKDLFLIDKEYNVISFANKNLSAPVWGAVCRMWREGHEKAVEFFYTLDEAIKAGQYPPRRRDGSPNLDSPWEKHFKTMLLRKAQAAAVKFMFPEALVGVAIAEYEYDLAPDLKDVSPSRGAPQELQSARETIKRARGGDAALSAVNEQSPCKEVKADIELDQKEAQDESRD